MKQIKDLLRTFRVTLTVVTLALLCVGALAWWAEAHSIGGSHNPIVAREAGTVTALGQCAQRGRSSGTCAYEIQFSNGSLVHMRSGTPRSLGERASVITHCPRGEETCWIRVE